jgi:hypothetical protein
MECEMVGEGQNKTTGEPSVIGFKLIRAVFVWEK